MIGMMLTKKRSRIDIVGRILSVCIRDSLKTSIMYDCNLNHEQVEDYLRLLVDRGLLEKVERAPGSRRYVYRLTDLGRKCLEAYKQFAEILNAP